MNTRSKKAPLPKFMNKSASLTAGLFLGQQQVKRFQDAKISRFNVS
jgi:hypothetical protein